MSIENLDSIIEQFFFWLGVVLGSCSLIYIFSVEVNRRRVFQSSNGARSLQSDLSVGYAMIGVIISAISITASLKGIHVKWGIIASVGFVAFLCVANEAYRRAFGKAIAKKWADFTNKIEVITQGKNRKS
ncbi:MAG: hypothetical protein ACTSXA_04535 [Candidatus Heimdallarchaeota archaeon]